MGSASLRAVSVRSFSKTFPVFGDFACRHPGPYIHIVISFRKNPIFIGYFRAVRISSNENLVSLLEQDKFIARNGYIPY
jgi:hypothetical protein